MQTTRTPYSISFMATVLLLLLFACHSTVANAAVALGATRVIYPANQKQVLLPVTNNDPASVYLIQSWIENAGDQKDTQFVITPPLFSMQGKKENTLRIINATNHQLPGDRESLFWVNVKAIPAMEKDQKNENTLQLAIISRIKMFYRPTNLAMAPEEAPAMLRFRRSGSNLTLINPTPYFITVTNMKAGNILDKDYAFSDGEILMVDNAVRTHFEPYERHFKEIGFNENTIKKYLQCTNIQTVTMPVPAKFLRASNVPTGLLNEMIAYLNSEERNHHNFSELLLFSCLSIFATCKGFITLLTNGVLSVSGKVRNIVNMKLAHPWKLKDICDCLYISESLLKKKLKQEQTTFSQILLDARMQHAKNLIRVEGSVNKIAEQCGYASTSYFIYAFRKHFGNSPKRVSKEYRCQRHTGMNTGNTMNALAI
ncbi:transcriptional regulator YdeO [Escherichia coli]|nr:transcriptional regulator YdeO [Escherichia coli]